MNCIVYQMWEAMDPLTGSAVVFQCSHMTRVHGQPHSLSQLKKLTFLWHTNTMSPINENLFKMMHVEVHT